MNKFAVSKDLCDSNKELKCNEEGSKYTSKENGLFIYHERDTKINRLYYYYRGAVTNNYVKLGKENGEDLYWRILYITDDNKMKLVLDKTIPLYVTSESGEKINLEQNDKLLLISSYNNHNSISGTFLNYDLDKDQTGNVKCISNSTCLIYYYEKKLNNKDFDSWASLADSGSGLDAISVNIENNWLESNLNEYANILYKDNVCTNASDRGSSINIFKYKNNDIPFECIYDNNSVENNKINFYLTTQDLIRAGIIIDNNVNVDTKNDNYLLNNSNNYQLIEKAYAYTQSGGKFEYRKYYLIDNSIRILDNNTTTYAHYDYSNLSSVVCDKSIKNGKTIKVDVRKDLSNNEITN